MGGVSWRYLTVALVLVALAGLVLVAAAVGGQLATTAGTPTAGVDNHSEQVGVPEGELGAGEQLAGLVATEDQTVRGSVDRGAFQAQFDAAGSPEERADLIASRLRTVDQRLADLEGAIEALAADGETDGVTARAAAVGAEAATLGTLLADLEAAMLELPAAEREQRNLTARLGNHRERVARLRERTQIARGLVGGANTETRAGPVTPADVREAVDRAVDSGSQTGRFFGSEQVDLHVRRANGSTLRLAVDTDGGAVAGIERGPHENPSVRVYTDYGVVRMLQRTDDPGRVLQDAFDDNRIVYDGVGLFDSMRYGVADILEWLGT